MATVKRQYKDKILSKDDIEKLSVKELVELYNSVAEKPLTAAFKDKATAVDKTWKLGAKWDPPAEEKPAATQKEPAAPKMLVINCDAQPAEKRKPAVRGTAVDTCALMMSAPNSATLDEMAAATGKSRSHVVGIVRWLGWNAERERGLGYGIETLEDGKIRLVDEKRQPLVYVQRADDAEEKAKRKAAREEKAKERAEAKAAKAKERSDARVAKDAEKAKAKEQKDADKAAKKEADAKRLADIRAQAEKAKAANGTQPSA